MAKTKYSFAEVFAAAQNAKTKFATAQALGVHFTTIENYCKRWPSLEEFFRKARWELVSLAESGLWEHVRNGEPWAISFALKTLGKDLGFTERKEVVEISEPLEIITKVVVKHAED